ncbi:hypothetical protein HHI36_006733 [Cryptolaemus montrouzieri]|uniref:MADF domain-containing protein n=1 Tax=Cryptolaemus montrouzieri TaxID=559131 RepID=A0ABD2NZB7_9CUCU
MNEWDNEECLKFLDLYKSEPVIWNPTNSQHKNKKLVNEAWIRLSCSMNRSVQELKKKKDSLMATFRGHLRKKRASICSGAAGDDIYQPIWFAFDVMEHFLAPGFKIKSTVKTEQNLSIDEALMETTTFCDELDDCSDFDTNQNQHFKSNTSSPSTTPSISQQTTRKHKHPPELREAEIKMKEAFSMLKEVVRDGQQKEDDECELYGKMLAKKLRRFDDIDRQIIMHRIDGMIIDALTRPNMSSQPQTTAYSNESHFN